LDVFRYQAHQFGQVGIFFDGDEEFFIRGFEMSRSLSVSDERALDQSFEPWFKLRESILIKSDGDLALGYCLTSAVPPHIDNRIGWGARALEWQDPAIRCKLRLAPRFD